MMHTNLWRVFLCVFLFAFYSCSKSKVDPGVKPGPDPDPKPTEITNPWNKNPYKLNVFYFVPNDVDTFANFKNRLSQILLRGQKEFADDMEKDGYGRKSFGLNLINDKTVNVIYLKGKFGKEKYMYEGGGPNIKAEVDAYLEQNPGDKKSVHHLIIVPAYDLSDPYKPSGPPYYGSGTYCYALDFQYLDVNYLGTSGARGNSATVFIGGLLHELGHGLNASHDKMIKSMVPSRGTSLMSDGNYTYGKSLTTLSRSSTATFNSSQAFSTETRSDWYTTVNNEITELSVKYENGSIVIDGKFQSSKKVNDIIVWNDPAPFGAANTDYDAISWSGKVVGTDGFHFVCPLTDFYKLEGDYQLRIGFVHENGTRTKFGYNYTFVNSIPQISGVAVHKLEPTTGWSILGKDSEEWDGMASSILDNNRNTFWHSTWRAGQPTHPHWVAVDMGEVRSFKGLAFRQRDNLNGALKDVKVYQSTNGTEWTLLKSFQLPNVNGSWSNIDLGSTISTRYLKIESQNSWGDFYYANLADFGIYK
ncbi:discoidin domain-containing protein [Sphingobacterium kyonggiense]